ncbi:hypothetical protein [Caulobacter sp.]|uniref:hypothetical protein n=1 Tax=Caulobacter sp. TaxID=78 RepID=UPI001B23081E|nr:hypothetical protein [Caulobacter sp.]MBO9545406.1 hypothetical protein [Caulobacter sp.]
MTTHTRDQWKTVIERGVAALDFRIDSPPQAVKPTMVSQPAPQKRALPVLIFNAVAAAAVVDTWVAGGEGEVLIDRPAILARQKLVNAKAAEPPGSSQSPFSTGYAASYRLELARLLWLAIIDAPAERLETLAASYAPPEQRTKLV